MECPIAISEIGDYRIGRTSVEQGEIQLVVSIEIANRYRKVADVGAESARFLEGAVSVAQQDRLSIEQEIEFPVVVEVTRCNAEYLRLGNLFCCLESTVAVTQENVSRFAAGDRQIEDAIVIKIADRYAYRAGGNLRRRPFCETPFTVA